MSQEATSDLWWKNAIVYCVDTQAYLDTNGDGIGDLDGLTQSIDYLAGLGVTCLWLMPIYPSPERDYGYDVADYYGVAAKYGTLGDLVELVRAARERGIRVIADLVVNHTSKDHPWFQAARSDRASIYHDFYVWADERPPNAHKGVIFPGQQDRIWSFDRAARRWYMHRFHPHQPDLNINDPLVRNEIHKVMGFWLELGLSGFRVDAVPFLIEQVGGSNPAVADPHGYLRDLRDFMTRRRGDAILLAEANEPANKLTAFVGEHGDQMHMLFNFIVNQALYLAFVRGNAQPVRDALGSLPALPPEAQWANFIKNHDEQSLDKLTGAERAEVFAAFGPRASMQLYGRGIRRRFPTMVGGDRRRMELAYSLLFTLPGTPVLFYGEEIGLGDDQRLADREAVRVPMQWSPRPGAGFTAAETDRMPRRPVREGPFGYHELNVESLRADPGSFLNWMERAIRTRKEWPEFGWGTWRVLGTRNDATLAVLTTWDGESALAVHNFSAAPTRVSVRLPAEAAGGPWREIFGPAEGGQPDNRTDDSHRERAASSSKGPRGGRLTLELEPYGYRWFGSREAPTR
jgi:maltose alpha-D-glucosyltransferase/alpha-amylase